LNESSNVPHVLNLKTLPLEPWKKTAFPVLFSGLGGSIPLQLPAQPHTEHEVDLLPRGSAGERISGRQRIHGV